MASLLLSFSTSCPGALTFILTLSTWTHFLLPSPSLLLCLTLKASLHGETFLGLLLQTYPTTTPPPGRPPLEMPSRVFCPRAHTLAPKVRPKPSSIVKTTFFLD